MVGRDVSYPEYENWLDLLGEAGGELSWVLQKRTFPLNTSNKKQPTQRTLDEIRRSVLASSRVQSAMQNETLQRGCPSSEVLAEAEEMLDIMAHKYSLNYVRPLGYAVSKVLRRLFDGIYVNTLEAQRVRKVCQESPVVFMPTHRTYLDFLLLSLVCFQYEIPLPAIAAGMDFMNSAFMGAVLRRNGAFFMRRSFGKDALYWAVFTEYVQTHLVHSDRPVEFFVEATRSRVGKSLHPKYGLLQILVEPYIRGNVYDITVVPVSMNYDKILEEMLYAYELLGFPKPKESTSGLFKAREILDHNFGKCFITFGDPISLRDYFGTSLHRSSFVCKPDSQFEMDDASRAAIRRFGHHVVRQNDRNSVITVWPLACLSFLLRLDANDDSVFRYNDILGDITSLYHLLKRLGVTVHVAQTLDHDFRYYLSLHSELFHPISFEGTSFLLRLRDLPVEKDGAVSRALMERAVTRLILTTYANVLMHGVYETGFIACILLQRQITSIPDIQKEYEYLLSVLRREFVYVPTEEAASFRGALLSLEKAELVRVVANHVRIADMEGVMYLRDILMPYINQFLVVLTTVLDSPTEQLTAVNVVKEAQQAFVQRYEQADTIPVRLAFLSTEPIKNTFNTLSDLGALKKKGPTFARNTSSLRDIYLRISQYLQIKEEPVTILSEAKL